MAKPGSRIMVSNIHAGQIVYSQWVLVFESSFLRRQGQESTRLMTRLYLQCQHKLRIPDSSFSCRISDLSWVLPERPRHTIIPTEDHSCIGS